MNQERASESPSKEIGQRWHRNREYAFVVAQAMAGQRSSTSRRNHQTPFGSESSGTVNPEAGNERCQRRLLGAPTVAILDLRERPSLMRVEIEGGLAVWGIGHIAERTHATNRVPALVAIRWHWRHEMQRTGATPLLEVIWGNEVTRSDLPRTPCGS
jgi:hypothetical protein